MYVALVIQHTMRMCHIATDFFHTIS